MRHILLYLGTVRISRNVQNKIHNLQITLEQFTDETKKVTKYKSVEIAPSINNNPKNPQT